ncbi:MAG: hypothetical protein AAGI38_09235 [Bacteroidota bacterium]
MKLILAYHPRDIDQFEQLKSICQEVLKQTEIVPVTFPQKIPQALANAQTALLLLSPNFLSKEVEDDPVLDELLAKTLDEELSVVTVIGKECEWQESLFSSLVCFPSSKQAFSEGIHPQKLLKEELLQFLQKEHLRVHKPATYLRELDKEKKQSEPFLLFMMRFGWRMLPKRVKWRLALLIVVVSLLIAWLFFR